MRSEKEKAKIRQVEISYILNTFPIYKGMREIENLLDYIKNTKDGAEINRNFLALEKIIEVVQKECYHSKTTLTFDRQKKIRPHSICLECGMHLKNQK